ncbi:MAG TPA: hypothetical protein VMU35_04855 [Methylomirabilota bacterium]|nr:hypothetical protein [Methylomirabilota bacterium]
MRHFFLAMDGLNIERPSNPGTLCFASSNECTHVSILTPSDIIQRNRVIDTLLHLSSLRYEGTQPYVAAPRLLCATLDSQIIRSSGIGLLVYDERRIEEVIKPERIQPPRKIQQEPAPSNADSPLLSELAELKSRYAELEQNITLMRSEFKSVQALASTSIQPSHDFINEHRFDTFQHSTPPFASSRLQEGSLPSFFVNNPWLDVLAKRGRTEDPPLAG